MFALVLCYPLFRYFNFLLSLLWTLATLINPRDAKRHLIFFVLFQELAKKKPHLVFQWRKPVVVAACSAMLLFAV